MLDKNPNASIDLSDLGGRKLDIPVPTKSKSPIDLSDLGGKQISGPFVSENSANPIDLSDLGGKRLHQHQPDTPEESEDSKVVHAKV
jgi:hypothetical protein